MRVSDVDFNALGPTISKAQARAILRRDWKEIDRMIADGTIPTIPGQGKVWIPTHRFLVKMGLKSETDNIAKELAALREEITELKRRITEPR